MLKLKNLSKYYYSGNNVVVALRKIDLEFKIGEFVAITGESGSGKSTLLNVLSGLDTYEDGAMFIKNEDISHYTVNQLEDYRKKYIGFVFQDYNIIDSYTVFQNVELALIIQGYDKKSRKARVMELIEQVGLSKVLNQKSSKLSGGEKQRTVIARALAKDCPIIVCDEPTGNLDYESSKSILKLLHNISQNKLVIVVSHDFSEIQEFATRKIRLYDGEIVEDESFVDNSMKEKQHADVSINSMSNIDLFKTSLNNILAVPKKSFFSLLIISFMILGFILAFGLSLKERNVSLRTESDYFLNANDSRLVITKRDDTSFTAEELSEIKTIEYVREVVRYDLVFDSTYTNVFYNSELGYEEFFDYKVLAADSLDEFDLLRGRLPLNENEIVIAENKNYDIDDYISIKNRFMFRIYDGVQTDQFTFKIVGVIKQNLSFEDNRNEMYFHIETLEEMHYSAIYETAQSFFVVDSNRTDVTTHPIFVLNWLKSYGLTHPIRVDNTLPDMEIRVFDMFFFDMCRDFGYRIEIIDDFDAGLCIAQDFIDAHIFSINVYTRFEDVANPVLINVESVPVTPNVEGQGLYVNQSTFNLIFDDQVYQPSVVVYDMFEAKQVKEELEAMGYNVFYPSGIIDENDASLIILRNLQLTLILGVTTVVIYFVGYFVMRNIIISKEKDYVIYRSIGASKGEIEKLVLIETIYLTMISFAIIIGLLILNEYYDTFMPRLLRYFNVWNYLFQFIIIFMIMLFMARTFNKRIFHKSVISSLKVQ